MQEDKNTVRTQPELSDTWLELLGRYSKDASATNDGSLPSFESDPWSSLLHSHGVESVDLQKIHLPMSDSDVEQLLQYMYER